MACAALAVASVTTAYAGGMLTNTNQNIAFLRNPARDAAIGIDGVYSNPAGVAFLNDGWHLSLNWQAAFQTRTVQTTSPYLDHNLSGNAVTKEYKGNAQAPFLPSIQLAKNTGRWSFQFNFSVTGGGGKCEFDKGLGSFESAVGQIGTMLQPLGVNGYDVDCYMQGKQYYFGFQLGAAYKITDNLSVFGGLRALYGTASYKAKIENILVSTASAGSMPFGTFIDASNASLNSSLEQVNAGIAQLDQVIAMYGAATPHEYIAQREGLLTTQATLESTLGSIEQLEVYREGVNLQSDQHGFGIAPVFGVDWKIGRFNLAGKYEFRTKMSMKNSSTVKEAMAIEAVNQFQDGTSIREDSPALLALGVQYSPVDIVRLNLGYHHFYDKQAKKYGNKQDLLEKGTNEYLGGVEVDLTDRLTVSAGGQLTRYGLSDEYMSDMSFVVNSCSLGFGAKYKVNPAVTLQAAYFKTLYEDYKTADLSNKFTRTNDVIGVGCDIEF